MDKNIPYPTKDLQLDERAQEAARNTAKQEKRNKTTSAESAFKVGDAIVYAAHGVGRVEKVGPEEIAGVKIKMIQISFPGNHMVLRIPLTRAASSGLRKIASKDIVNKAMEVIKGKPQRSRGMWARRALGYQEKITSGNLLQIAEVLRDLRHNIDGEGSKNFSEKKIFEAAQDRFVTEVAVFEKKSPEKVLTELVSVIKKLPKA